MNQVQIDIVPLIIAAGSMLVAAGSLIAMVRQLGLRVNRIELRMDRDHDSIEEIRGDVKVIKELMQHKKV